MITFTLIISVGKNQPLKREKPKWKADVPLTDGQLRSKRDEFWDTAPAFEGRKEIWDAMRAASRAAECNEYDLAQAIVDGAGITLPNGSLTDAYDELGNRYQLPIYCLAAPVNLIETNTCSHHVDNESPSPESEPFSCVGEEIMIKFRVSTLQNDIKMGVFAKEYVLQAKKRLSQIHGLVPPKEQRWYFGGRLLHDKMRIDEIKLQSGFVVQVVIRMRS